MLHCQVARGKGCDERFRLPLDKCPGKNHKRQGIDVGEFHYAFDTVEKFRPVVKSDDGLGSVDESKERHYNNGYHAVQDAEGGNSHIAAGHGSCGFQALVSVGGKAPGENGVHQAVANLHYGRRQSQNVNLTNVGEAQLHVATVDFYRGGLLQEEVGDEQAAYQLGTNGCPGGALDTPVQTHDKYVIQHHVGDRTDNLAEHGGLGVTHGSDKVVHARSHRLEDCAKQNDAHIAGSHGEGLVASAKEAEQRFHEGFANAKGSYGHDNEQNEGIVQDNGCLFVFLFAKTNGEEGVGAHADDHGHCHDEKSDGEAEGDACDAEASYALTNKETVHYIIQGVHHHANDGGYRKLQNQLRDAGCAKGFQLIVT